MLLAKNRQNEKKRRKNGHNFTVSGFLRLHHDFNASEIFSICSKPHSATFFYTSLQKRLSGSNVTTLQSLKK
jgi:hypothetical protein